MVEENGDGNEDENENREEDRDVTATERDLLISATPSQSAAGTVKDSLDVSVQPTKPRGFEECQKSDEGISTEVSYDNDDSIGSHSADSSSYKSSSFSMLNPTSTMDEADVQAISLLKQIFPEESSQTLRALHHQHVQSKSPSLQESQNHFNLPSMRSTTMGENTTAANMSNSGEDSLSTKLLVSTPQSKLGRRLWHQYLDEQSFNMGINTDEGVEWKSIQLPEDFLRFPVSVAVRRPYDPEQQYGSPYSSRAQSNVTGSTIYRYEFIADMHEQALQEYWMMINFGSHSHRAVATNYTTSSNTSPIQTLTDREAYYTVVIHRHPKIGLGLSLTQHPQDCNQLFVHGLIAHPQNPCTDSGIIPGDQLIGVNGAAFIFLPSSEAYRRRTPIQDAVDAIQHSPNPIVLHFARGLSLAMYPQARPIDTHSQTDTTGSGTPSTCSGTSPLHRSLHPAPMMAPNYPAVERNTSLLDVADVTSEELETIASTLTSMPTLPTPSPQYPGVPATTESLSGPFPRMPRLLGLRKQRKTGMPVTPGGFLRNSTLHRGQPSSRISIHPFAKALAIKGLIRGMPDEQRITQHIQRFTERTRQWESFSSLRIDPVDHGLVPQFHPSDLPVEMRSLAGLGEDSKGDDDNEEFTNICPPSTPPLSAHSPLIPANYLKALSGCDAAVEGDPGEDGSREFLRRYQQHFQQSEAPTLPQYQGYAIHQIHGFQSPILVPLFNVRKALSTRIVNSFVEESGRVAYTVWVHDVEHIAKEWYAPVRYLEDFEELRAACIALAPPQAGVQEWDFPKSSASAPKRLLNSLVGGSSGASTGLFRARGKSLRDHVNSDRTGGIGTPAAKQRRREAEESEQIRETKCRQLEGFLRNLCSLVYTCEPLPPNIAEMAIHVQSFLGVEAGLADTTELEGGIVTSVGNSLVHRDLQHFAGARRHSQTTNAKKAARARQDLKMSLQRYTYRLFLLNVMKAIVHDFLMASRENGPTFQEIESLEHEGTLKSRATGDLERIQNFLDQIVDLILEGCEEDLRGIARRHHYRALHSKINQDESYWERLAREAVREQVEIEVYVPLRSVASRLLVNGWRHEDMEVQFKVRELRKRPQIMFRIPQDKVSPTDWQSVAYILKRGVGMSTLPCCKLRAIVEAAREISRLYQEEHGEESVMGADEFLPVFIFCVVRADMERPCALTILLQTLCDRMNRIGEIGYFLASFQAAISHIQELDLTEDMDAMLPFLTEELPMTEVSLGE